jgi:hypothetical protein
LDAAVKLISIFEPFRWTESRDRVSRIGAELGSGPNPIARIAPDVPVIDLGHDFPRGEVRPAALALLRAIQYLPEGVVLAVVDPAVGTGLRAIAARTEWGHFVGPDNGLLAPAVAMAGGAERAFELTNPDYQLLAPGATFAGRDVFAPVAAHLCNGVALEAFGEPVDPDLLLPGVVPVPRDEDGGLACEVTWVDRFGNCQLNVGPDEVAAWGDRLRVTIEGTPRSAPVVATFAEAGAGLALVIDSYGMLALCVDRNSAAAEFAVGPGSAVHLAPFTDGAADRPVITTRVELR